MLIIVSFVVHPFFGAEDVCYIACMLYMPQDGLEIPISGQKSMPYQEKWPPRPGAAPPEAPKIWGTGAYNTIIFGTTHDDDLCIQYIFFCRVLGPLQYFYLNISDEGRHMAMMLKKQRPKLSTSSPGNGHLRLWPPRPGAAPPEAPKIWGTEPTALCSSKRARAAAVARLEL